MRKAAALGSLNDILRIAAEQDFASDGQELMFDCASSSNAKGACALLVAAPRPVVDQLLAAARAAGLTVAAITSSALELAQATAPPPLIPVTAIRAGSTSFRPTR